MIHVLIIGNGNVASHLATAFEKNPNIALKQISSRALDSVPMSDVAIIAVSDDAISEVANKLVNYQGLLVHTSGSVDVKQIKAKRNGVFYPLQSFTKGKKVDFTQVPFCLEASVDSDLLLLEKLAQSLGAKAYRINSLQRKKIHLAAVFANNFTNHMYSIANDICDQEKIPFEILHPLIAETANKVQGISPKEAQTGPAIRRDQQTIEKHISQLTKEQQRLYLLITKSIQSH
ncbi:hypothetical protein GCM10011416_17980 [Polaribacter pacificus]|uniref:DUF2520 domain-containing protein n=1 Tax=Polaribacter pacificus TaxID=1775173 RepID=A0A917HZX1_9FLAO|nr:DUF2520 domain-containing protein [Polaribacter pacificus]GGG99920.1 hypothetical protein GCM10011416_17980 [Polaribacter pacificus]